MGHLEFSPSPSDHPSDIIRRSPMPPTTSSIHSPGRHPHNPHKKFWKSGVRYEKVLVLLPQALRLPQGPQGVRLFQPD